MSQREWDEVGNAILIWTGRGICTYPERNEARLVASIGVEKVANLLPVIRELENVFYSSDVRFRAKDLAEMYKIGSDEFQKKYQRLPRAAVEALAWCYKWDYK